MSEVIDLGFCCGHALIGQPEVCEECCGCFAKDPCEMCPKPHSEEVK